MSFNFVFCTFSFALFFRITIYAKIEKPLKVYVRLDPFCHKNLFVLAITHKFYRFSKDLANPGASAEFSINSFLVNLLSQTLSPSDWVSSGACIQFFEFLFPLSPPFNFPVYQFTGHPVYQSVLVTQLTSYPDVQLM